MARDETQYDDMTMAKVHEALRRAGLSLNGTENAINLMQNAGVLFRERGPASSDIENRFKYHKPQTAKRADQHDFIREACRGLADDFTEALPDGREKKLAITKVEEAMFWANAALARTPDVPTVEREAIVQSGPLAGMVVRNVTHPEVDMRMSGQPADMTDVSDGYHTFGELYDHRRALTAALAVSNPTWAWRSKRHHPQGDPIFDGYFIIGIDLPNGTITYHYKLSHWDDFSDVPERAYAKRWDGASSADTVFRLLEFARTDDLNRRLEQAGVQRAPEGYPRTFPGPNPPPVTDQDRTEIRELIEAGTPPLKATSDVLARKLEQAGIERAPEGTDPNTWKDEDESPPDPDDSALGPDPRDEPTGGVPGRDHPGLDGAWHSGHMEECGRCNTFAEIHDPGQGNYGPGQPRDPRDVPPGY